jgi:uncharacterized protein
MLAGELGLPARTVPAGYWKGFDQDTATLDFVDFIVVVREDMAGEVAYLLAWCLTEKRAGLQSLYAHIPPERSPLSYPLVPGKMAIAPLALHVGARRYFESAGHLAV